MAVIPRVDVYKFMIVWLLVSAFAAIFMFGLDPVSYLSHLVIVTFIAVALDTLINRIKLKKWTFSSSGAITGLILSTVLAPEMLIVQVVAPVAAILSKHVIKWGRSHIFNPAAFGMLVVSIAFGIFPAWWGATILLVGFLYADYLVKKLPLAFSFLIALFVLGVITTGSFGLGLVTDLTTLFFIFVMGIEPRTTPVSSNMSKIVFGVGLAIVATVLPLLGVPWDVYVVSLLVMNLFTIPLNKWKKKPKAVAPVAPAKPPEAKPEEGEGIGKPAA